MSIEFASLSSGFSPALHIGGRLESRAHKAFLGV